MPSDRPIAEVLAEPNVRVHITCTSQVEYSQAVTISAAEFAEYEAAVARNERDRWFGEFAERYIDFSEVSDCGDCEDVEVVRCIHVITRAMEAGNG